LAKEHHNNMEMINYLENIFEIIGALNEYFIMSAKIIQEFIKATKNSRSNVEGLHTEKQLCTVLQLAMFLKNNNNLTQKAKQIEHILAKFIANESKDPKIVPNRKQIIKILLITTVNKKGHNMLGLLCRDGQYDLLCYVIQTAQVPLNFIPHRYGVKNMYEYPIIIAAKYCQFSVVTEVLKIFKRKS